MTSTHLNVYAGPEQAAAWADEATGLDMGTSEYIRAMVEAGRKKFDFDGYLDPDPNVDVTEAQLREQRDRARRLADEAEARVRRLEDDLDGTDRAATLNYILERPGVDYESILTHVQATAAERLTAHLDRMEGDEVRVTHDDGERERFYPGVGADADVEGR